MNDVIELVSIKYETDEIGNQIEVESKRKTYCMKKSITQSEFYTSRQYGLEVKEMVVVNAFDWMGETKAIFNGIEYRIIRTYARTNDLMELYLAS